MAHMGVKKYSGILYFLFSLSMLCFFFILLQLPAFFAAAGYTAITATIHNICYKTFVYENFLDSDYKRFFLAIGCAVIWPAYFVLALFFFLINGTKRF